MSDGTWAVVAGIDEAGYGPILGPLVVSRSAFLVPAERSQSCLWQLLCHSVTDKPSRRERRLPIADSKKLYHQPEDLHILERTAQVMLRCAGDPPGTFTELFRWLGCDHHSLSGYPWYEHFDDRLPMQNDPALLDLLANDVGHDLKENGIRFLGAGCALLPEGHYNRMVEKTRNKSTVLWSLTLQLLADLIARLNGRELVVCIDRHGGRTGYAQALLSAFEGCRLEVVREDTESSHYRLSDLNGQSPWRAEVIFRAQGESHSLPVALASIFSKYLRELLMVAFNRYWQQQVGSLRRTAGYYQDGLRFLKDIEPALCTLAIDRKMLVRCR